MTTTWLLDTATTVLALGAAVATPLGWRFRPAATLAVICIAGVLALVEVPVLIAVAAGGLAAVYLLAVHSVAVPGVNALTAPVVFEVELDALRDTVTPAYREVSRFPAVTRDLALVVEQGVAAAGLLKGLLGVAPTIVQRIELFDQYQGKGIEPNRKSLAFRVTMQETQRTLEDAEVDAAMAILTVHAEEYLGAKLRA